MTKEHGNEDETCTISLKKPLLHGTNRATLTKEIRSQIQGRP